MIVLDNFLQFSIKPYDVGTQLKCLIEALQMNTHVFYGEMIKRIPNITKYSSGEIFRDYSGIIFSGSP